MFVLVEYDAVLDLLHDPFPRSCYQMAHFPRLEAGISVVPVQALWIIDPNASFSEVEQLF